MSIYDLPLDLPPEQPPKKPSGEPQAEGIAAAQPQTKKGTKPPVSVIYGGKPPANLVEAPGVISAPRAMPPASVYVNRPGGGGSEAPKQDPPKKKRRGCGCAVGCLGMLLLPVLLGGISLAVAAWKAPAWIHQAAVAAVLDSDLAEDDKEQITAELNRLYDGYASGEIGVEQLQKVGEQLVRSPLFQTMVAHSLYDLYVSPSGLTAVEKEQARTTLRRVAHGLHLKRITRRQLDTGLDFISTADAEGQRQFSEQVTDDHIRSLLSHFQAVADSAAIPATPPQVDPGDEFARVVQRAF